MFISGLTEGVRIGFDSIRANIFRSGLTILGVGIGVGVVVLMSGTGGDRERGTPELLRDPVRSLGYLPHSDTGPPTLVEPPPRDAG
jgi:hypothetical protein